MDFFKITREVPTVGSDVVFYLGSWPIVNSTLLILLILLFLFGLGLIVRYFFKFYPSRFQVACELLFESIYKLIRQISGSDHKAKIIFPLSGALIVYIALANFIGLIPGLTSITYNGISIFRTPTADFNTTFSLALAMVFLIQILSIADFGLFGYIGRFIKIGPLISGFSKGFKDGMIALLEFMIGLLDIISEAAKVISLSLRLFGNMYAGEVLAVILLGILAIGLPAVWLAMNLLSALVQAIVFAALVTVYYTLSVKTKKE